MDEQEEANGAAVPGLPDDTRQAVSLNLERYYAAALKRPLVFRPPLMDLATTPRNFIFWWKLLNYVFDLPTPALFPSLGPFSPDEARVLQRFVHSSEQLATSRLINHPVKWQLRGGQGVDSEGYIDRPDDEVMRGALTLFRQIYVGSELASFGVVKNILARRSLERGEAGTEALRQIRMWAQAHSDLERAPLPTLADEAVIACEEGREPGPADWPEDLRPDTLIKTYAYGDFIHWGDRAQDRQAYASSVAMDVLTMSHLLDVVCGFSHLYMGFALVVNQALHEWNDAFGRQF
jgi:hypothetical protein